MREWVLLYSTGNRIQYNWINHNGKEYEKEHIYAYNINVVVDSGVLLGGSHGLSSVCARREGDSCLGNPMGHGRLQSVCVYVCVLVAHSCLTLCDPIDCRPPGSSVHGIYIYIYIYSYCCLVARSCVILLQPHGLANPLDRGAWGAIVHETAKSWTQLNTHTHTHTHTHTLPW